MSHDQGLTFYLFKVAAHVQRINRINIRAKEGSCHSADGPLVVLLANSLLFWLTCVVCNQFLQGWEGVVGGDVVSTFVHGADFVVFYHISLLGYVIPDWQRVGPWGAEEDSRGHGSGEVISCARGPSPGEVSLSRTRKEPLWFPGAKSSRSVSFLLMSLKNHLREREDAFVTQAGPDWQNLHV